MKKPLFFVGLGLAVLVGLFLLLRPAPISEPAPVAATGPVALPPIEVEIQVAQGRRVAGPDRILARQGNEVVLKVSSDRPDKLHLHGYDLHAEVRPGAPAALVFTATHTGRFAYELHEAQLELGTLEVTP